MLQASRAQRRQITGHKGGSKKPKQPSIASNSVPSISTARLVYLWSWGPIVGPVNGLRSVKLDGTPIMAEDGTVNYPGVKWQFRSGELHQDRLEGVTESSNEIQVAQELRTTAPWVYSINNPVIDAVRVRFGWPVLQAQDSGGNINGVRIDYAIDVATDGGTYQQVLASYVDRKNVTKYERSHRIDLPEGSSWTIRARRITPEANSSLVQDAMVVEAIAEVVDSDQEYPLTAVGCVEYDAQQFGGDFPKIAVLMRGRIVRVPMNYDPETRTYATGGPGTSGGIWDGSFKEAYTNNPAWVFYDLALHPYYGLGDRIDSSMINRWSLYRIAQWCDQLVPDGKGGQEPRFTCNLYLQKQAEAVAHFHVDGRTQLGEVVQDLFGGLEHVGDGRYRGELRREFDARVRLGSTLGHDFGGVGEAGLLHPENRGGGGSARGDQVSDEQALLRRSVDAGQALRLDDAGGNVGGQQGGADRNVDALAALNAGRELFERFALDHHAAEAVLGLRGASRRQARELLLELAQLCFQLLLGLGQAVELGGHLIDGGLGFFGQAAGLLGLGQGVFSLLAEIAGRLLEFGGNLLEQVSGVVCHGMFSGYLRAAAENRDIAACKSAKWVARSAGGSAALRVPEGAAPGVPPLSS